MKTVNKRFPADATLLVDTFLNNKKIDAELYALLQQYSEPVQLEDGNYETRVNKKNLPTQAFMCKKLGIASPKTYRVHLNYLLNQSYLIDCGDHYVLPNMEDIYFMIPLETLQYLTDNCKDQVIKIYIYLGQRWKYKQDYMFTTEEIGKHIGYSIKTHQRGYEMIKNALILLSNSELISYTTCYEDKKPYLKLTNFSFHFKKPSK